MGKEQSVATPGRRQKSGPGTVKTQQEAREREIAETRAAKRAARRARTAEVPGVLAGVVEPGAEAEHNRARKRSGFRGRSRQALPQSTGKRAQKVL